MGRIAEIGPSDGGIILRIIMNIETNEIFGAVVIGIGACVMMDLWNLFLKRAFGIPSLNYCLLGRWLCHIPVGVFRHERIAASPQKPFECAIGWAAHYSIGVVFALLFIVVAADDWLAHPTWPSPLLFGIATVIFPYFIMQPALGLGIAGSRTPNPTQARLKSLMTHAVFGAGLYVCALGVGQVLKVHV